jgi:hypothetical protein
MKYSMPTLNSLPPDSYLIIDNDNFIQYGKGIDSTKGRIRWIYECGLKLDILPKPVLDSNAAYTFGESFIELEKGNSDTLNFRITYTGNLHLTVYSGVILKVN